MNKEGAGDKLDGTMAALLFPFNQRGKRRTRPSQFMPRSVALLRDTWVEIFSYVHLGAPFKYKHFRYLGKQVARYFVANNLIPCIRRASLLSFLFCGVCARPTGRRVSSSFRERFRLFKPVLSAEKIYQKLKINIQIDFHKLFKFASFFLFFHLLFIKFFKLFNL